jgi:hypothetical protein
VFIAAAGLRAAGIYDTFPASFNRRLFNLTPAPLLPPHLYWVKVRCIGLMGTMDRDYERRYFHFPKYKLFMEDWDRIILDYVRRLPDGPLRWAALKQSREEGRSKLLLYTELRYGVPMMPIDFWYDKPHITTARTYLDYIFGQAHFNYESGMSVGAAMCKRC